jgi:hypothetical protein
MRITVHTVPQPFGITLHFHAAMPVVLHSHPALQLAATTIGLRGRQGLPATLDVAEDILDFITKLDEALNV